MGHFRSNLRDIEFNLFEVFNVQDRIGRAPFEEADVDTARDVLNQVNALATGSFSDSFVDSDRHPPVFDPVTHTVRVPSSSKDSYRLLQKGEWWRLEVPGELGGYGFPPTVRWAAAELLMGANPAVFMYQAGPALASVVHAHGTSEQRHWAELMVDRGWGATMVLTEPDAGSDVGAARTRAVAQPDGGWHLDGVKRFITSAEHDMTENIMHLVLARPEAPGLNPAAGTRGLSLFLVPKWHFDTETGKPGQRNGVFATNVEHKMGLKGSATCELTFGAHGIPATGYLLGGVHEGISQMFEVIEWARMMVGTKATGAVSTGYLAALDYAKQRVQGSDLVRMTDKTAPRVTITHHPDVRRLLMTNKAYAEGLRALCLYTASQQDQVRVEQSLGGDTSVPASVNDLLLPIVKGVASEHAPEQLIASLQVLGGSGYLQDYPIEQYIRDAKIDSVYEGTTAIQSLDLLFRKIVRDDGRALGVVIGEIRQHLDTNSADSRLKVERALLSAALDDVEAMLAALRSFLDAMPGDATNVYKVGQHSVRFLLAIGELLIGWLLLRQADVALAALDSQPADQRFYEGKVAVARFFARTHLPLLASHRAVVESADNALMELSEASF